jgi:lipopolysaccharide export system protein LptA
MPRIEWSASFVPPCETLPPDSLVPTRPLRLVALLGLAAIALAGPPARAEKADRFAPLKTEADLPSSMDLLNQVVVLNGNVVVTKGTIVIHAARIEVRQSPDGYHTAIAFGSPTQHATFRQKRDEPNEWIEGDAERLEYDGKSDVVRFVNDATWRRLRGAEMTDEINGNLITYDSATEVVNVAGHAPATASKPGGRVRAVLTPKEGTAAALEAAAAAASAASAAAPLKNAPSLGEKK